MEPVNKAVVSGVLIPYKLVFHNGVPAMVYNLPVAFKSAAERDILAMKIFGIIRQEHPLEVPGDQPILLRDPETSDVVPKYTREWLLSADAE
mgnify:CR=1 FL=1